MDIEVECGPRKVNDGSSNKARSDQSAALVTTDGHGRYQEATIRDNVYTVNAKTVTIAAGHLSPLTAATGTPIVGVYNPENSGVNLVILKAGISTISGTPGGPYYYDIGPKSTVITNFNATNPISNSDGNSTGSKGKNLSNTAITGGPVGVMLRPMGGPAAVAAGAGMYHVDEDLGGIIILKPGMYLAITGHAAGTTHVVSGYITYEEVPELK